MRLPVSLPQRPQILDDVAGGALRGLSEASRYARSQVTPDRYDSRATGWSPLHRPGALEEITATLAALDPRNPANWPNIATSFVPGGRGNGKLSPIQQMYLEQLRYDPRFDAPRAAAIAQASMNKTPHASIMPLTAKRHPGLKEMSEKLGYASGNPMMDLRANTHGNFISRLGVDSNSSWKGRSRAHMPLRVVEPEATMNPDMAFKSSVSRETNHPSHEQLVRMLAKNAIQRRN